MRRLLAAVAALAVAGLLVSELAMQPSARDRAVLFALFAGMAALSGGAGWWLLRAAQRFRSLRTTVLAVALAAVAAAAVAVVLAASSMFLSAHDARLVFIALGLGVGLGVVLAATVTRPLAEDLARLAHAARAVGAGELAVRTGVDRPDEVGEVARAMDAMIRQLDDARRDRERMESARRSFLAAVGHDLRTPLTALQAAVEALQDGIAPEPERYLGSMSRDIEALRRLVDDLFVLARIESHDLRLDIRPVDLAELITDVIEAMAPIARRAHVELQLECDGPVTVRGDPQALGRVVRNLIDNAIRHAPGGTAVRVELTANADGASLRVTDAGPGFPPGFAAQAFDGFSRADPARTRAGGGAGLGLAIARGLTQAHGGTIAIEPAQGASVRVDLPGTATARPRL